MYAFCWWKQHCNVDTGTADRSANKSSLPPWVSCDILQVNIFTRKICSIFIALAFTTTFEPNFIIQVLLCPVACQPVNIISLVLQYLLCCFSYRGMHFATLLLDWKSLAFSLNSRYMDRFWLLVQSSRSHTRGINNINWTRNLAYMFATLTI